MWPIQCYCKVFIKKHIYLRTNKGELKCPLCENDHTLSLTKFELVWEWHTSVDSLGILRKVLHENQLPPLYQEHLGFVL